MLQWIKRKYEYRQEFKAIRNAVSILRSLYPNLGPTARSSLVQVVWDMVAEFGQKWNKTDISEFYFQELNQIVMRGGK